MSHEKFTQAELEEKASEIMRNFNFEKVHEHMVATNWRWANSEGLAVPDMEDIRNCARSLLTGVIWDETSPVVNHGTGGFVAYKLPWGLQLTFQLAWSNS